MSCFMSRCSFKTAAGLLAMAGAVTLTAFAKEPPTESKTAGKAATAAQKGRTGEVAIPECLEKLKLSDSQQEQIKEIVGKYDTDLASAWKEFSGRYMETIKTEVLLLAAIEDNLSEAQRTQVRLQRRKMAIQEKALAGADGKPNLATATPVSAVDEAIGLDGVSLTEEQELAADKIQGNYVSRLRSLNRDIQGLHTRLVSLEADKLVEIEKVLTKDQLAQLREHRQSAPIIPKVAATRESKPTATE